MTTFHIEGKEFIYQGKPIQLLSGAVHYFRMMPEDWEDRLLKLKACGFNTVETYVAWNLHEPMPDQFVFDGRLDLIRFIQLAQKHDLLVIVRPGPYICSEFDLGGLPSWLLSIPDIQLRSMNKPYLERVDKFFDVLLPMIKPLLCENGGPIIAMQIENEYGSYGDDKKYLEYLHEGYKRRGMNTLYFTSDGSCDLMLTGGTLPGILKTVNFGSDSKGNFDHLLKHQQNQPEMCGEFWNGWFDQWGEEHHTRDCQEIADEMDAMLARGASVNVYMFHGGTNFAFDNGATFFDEYKADVTSYDSDAPINEYGDLTPKYFAIREVVKKYIDIDPMPEFSPIVRKNFGVVELSKTASLFENLSMLSEGLKSNQVKSMEDIGQDKGFILYRTFVPGPIDKTKLYIQGLRDRAQVFIDGVMQQDILHRNDPVDKGIEISIPKEGVSIDILVENLGRINYGPYLYDKKGILEGVRLDNRFIYDWTIFPLPLDNVTQLNYVEEEAKEGPRFYRGEFEVDEPEVTFVDLKGWTKGVVYINGFNLGRYWEVGPQETVYVPRSILRKGVNEMIIFELHGTETQKVECVDEHRIG